MFRTEKEFRDYSDLLSDFTPFEYYKFVREEIRKEDTLTNERIISSLTLQGFIFAASGYIISQFVETNSYEAKELYALVVIAIGVIGCLLSSISLMGVAAARASIDNLLGYWELIDKMYKIVPTWAPQVTGPRDAFRWGSIYYKSVPVILLVFWIFYLIAFSYFLYHVRFTDISSPYQFHFI